MKTDRNHTVCFENPHGTALDKGLAHMHFEDYLNSTSFYRKRECNIAKMLTGVTSGLMQSRRRGGSCSSKQ